MSRKQKSRKQLILDTLQDSISRFTYYDRKEDEELPRGAIENAVAAGDITIDEIVAHFRLYLEKELS